MKRNDTLQKILEIHQSHSLDNATKESQLKHAISESSESRDLLSFILSHKSNDSELLIPVIQAIERYSHLFIDIVHSPNLFEWIQWVESFEGPNRDALHSACLSMLKISWRLNLNHNPISTDCNMKIIEFSLSCMASKSLAVAEQASRVAADLMTQPYDSRYFSLLRNFTHRYQTEEVIVLRYLSLGATISEKSEAISRDVMVTGGFPEVTLRLCQSGDVLLAINALDLLSQFARTRIGLEELCKESILDWLITASCGSLSSRQVSDPLLESEGLRVLGEIFLQAANHSNEFVSKINHQCLESFLASVYRYLDEGKENEKITGLTLLSDFTKISTQSQIIVQAYRSGELLTLWMNLLNSAKPELQSAALIGLVKVFDQPDDKYVKNSHIPAPESVFTGTESKSESDLKPELETVTDFKKSLFTMVGRIKGVETVHYLVKAAKQPVSSIRNAAMDFIRSVVGQLPGGWGIRLLFNNGFNPSQSEFWTYLKDRTTEFSKEGKDFKFAIILALSESPYLQLLGEEVVNHLKLMASQGPYYMPPRLEEMETI